jgi:predicted transcriptional regulator
MTTVDVKLNVSEDVLDYLQREAGNRRMSLDAVVSAVLADYFDDPTEEAILAGLKRSMEQVLAGEYRPAHEVLDEIEREMGDDADEG